MKTLAELLNDLFVSNRRTDGREYSNAEISRKTNGSVDASYLGKLRSGKVDNPTRNTLIDLARVFGVQPDYFFPRENEAGGSERDQLRVALRQSGLSTEAQTYLEALIQSLRRQESNQGEL